MMRRSIGPRWQLALGAASVLLLLIFYTGLSYRQHQKNPHDRIIPSWPQLKTGFVQVVTVDKDSNTVWLWKDSVATFGRLASGLGLAVFLSVVIGIAMGCFTPAEAFFFPPMSVLAKIPPTAMLGVFFVLFQSDEFRIYVGMIVFGVLPTMTQAVFQAAKTDVPEQLISKSLTLGASQLGVIWHVVYKQILPRILDAIRLQIGPAMVFLIAAEWLYAEIGFGYRLNKQSYLSNMNVVYTYLAILGVAGFLLDFSIAFIRRKVCPWFEEN